MDVELKGKMWPVKPVNITLNAFHVDSERKGCLCVCSKIIQNKKQILSH